MTDVKYIGGNPVCDVTASGDKPEDEETPVDDEKDAQKAQEARKSILNFLRGG